MRRFLLSSTLVALGLGTMTGCGTGVGGSTTNKLDNLNRFPDANANGFRDLPAPTGVDDSSKVQIGLHNTITREQIATLIAAEGFDVPDVALNFINIRLEIDLAYDGGQTDTLVGNQKLGAFDLEFEVACPDSVVAGVKVIANIPFQGEQELFVVPDIMLSKDADYACESTVRVTVSLDDAGQVAVDVTIE